MRRFAKMFILMFAALLICGTALADGGEKLSIVVTSFPCYDFARQAAGEHADVHMLIRPGTEVHTYEPAPADIVAIQQADLFICIGGEGEGWVDGILSSMGSEGPAVLRLIDHVETCDEEHDHDEEHHHDSHHHEYDEHIWTSPKNAALMMFAVSGALCQADPDCAADYVANTGKYIAEIEAVDAEIRDIVDNAARRELVFGDRFPFLYFANEYGLDYHAAFSGCSSAAEPSAKTVAELIDHVKKHGVPAVYMLELSSGQIAQTIAAETGAEVLTMHSCQTVSLDDFEAGESYVSLMRRNIEALRKGLN